MVSLLPLGSLRIVMNRRKICYASTEIYSVDLKRIIGVWAEETSLKTWGKIASRSVSRGRENIGLSVKRVIVYQSSSDLFWFFLFVTRINLMLTGNQLPSHTLVYYQVMSIVPFDFSRQEVRTPWDIRGLFFVEWAATYLLLARLPNHISWIDQTIPGDKDKFTVASLFRVNN